jgi:hypothetical protein
MFTVICPANHALTFPDQEPTHDPGIPAVLRRPLELERREFSNASNPP